MSFILETPRFLMRPFAEKDILPFSEYRSDPETARYQGWEAPYTVEQATQFVAEMQSQVPGQPGQWFQIALELKSTTEMIGDCAFQLLIEDPRQAEIAFTLAEPFRGKGYAAEAVNRLLAYLFHDLGLHRVRANCDPENTASTRLLKAVGMRYEGCFVASLWFKGRWADEEWYAILEQEWEIIQHHAPERKPHGPTDKRSHQP